MTDPEEPADLRPTDAYRLARDLLSPRIRRHLKWAEEDIAENPLHAKSRHRLSDGSIIDYAVADDGQLIRYRVHPTHVELIELVDYRPRRSGWPGR
jgi:hypothetical protein